MIFKFKEFDILQKENSQKVGTDSMILGALSVQFDIEVNTVLDIGSGTGVLGLMLAQKFHPVHLTGIDIQELNCLESRMNFSNASFVNDFEVMQGDVRGMIFSKSFDFIISNPPYFKNALLSERSNKNTARHQDSLSINDLLEVVTNHLSLEGVFAVVYPFAMEAEVCSVAKKLKLTLCRCVRTIHKGCYVRSFMFFKRIETINERPLINDFSVRNNDGKYSQEYIELTRIFHYKDLSK